MKENQKIKMIGYTPNRKEQEQIYYIAYVYHLTNAGVIKNLFYNAVTLSDFYEKAKRYDAKRMDDEMDIGEMNSDGMVIL